MNIIVEKCRRHIHLITRAHQWLFGIKDEPKVKKVLNVGGEVCTTHRVQIEGTSMRASLLTPFRPYDQLEVSKSEYEAICGKGSTDEPGRSGNADGAKWVEVCSAGGFRWVVPIIIPEPHIHVSPKYKDMLREEPGFHLVSGEWFYALMIDDICLPCQVCYHITHENNGYVHLDVDWYAKWLNQGKDNEN